MWKAGLARAVITPDVPLWLAGYGGIRRAEGKRHDLWVKALALEDSAGDRAVVLTSDLVGLSQAMFRRLCRAIRERHGLTTAQVMLTYSHNHCAPVTSDVLVDYYPLDAAQWAMVDEYTRWLEGRILETIDTALDRLVPAILTAGEGRATFAVNRRNNREAEVGELLARGAPLQGPVDHTVPVLAVHSAEGELLALLFGYACHTTTLSDCLWCGDYAGYAQLALERDQGTRPRHRSERAGGHPRRATGPSGAGGLGAGPATWPDDCVGAQAMFWAGCGGDQNPLPRRSVELCRGYGEELAVAVREVLRQPMRPVNGRLRTAFATVRLPFERNPTREELLEASEGANALRARWARRMLRRLDAGEPFETGHDYAVQVWRLGEEQLWIALAGEAVVDYALRFRQEFGPRTWVCGYAHDLVAYVPSARVWQEGGYEGGFLYEYGWPADRWAPDVEERIAGCVQRLVAEDS
jgi:hypothetical protein